MRRQFVVFSIISIAGTAAIAHFAWPPFWWALVVIAPLVVFGFYDMLQVEHTIVRNFPLAGRGRYFMEALRPKIYQYFVESDIDGTPINRIFRSVVYQRAKGATDTVPFGTELDVNSIGYEWMNHSLAAHNPQEADHDLRVKVGGPDCKKTLQRQHPQYLGDELRGAEQKCDLSLEWRRTDRQLRAQYR
jgi:hypothetical protein